MELIYKVKEEEKVVDIIKKKLNISSRLLIKLKAEKAITFNNELIYVNEKVSKGILKISLDKTDLEEEEKIKEYLNLDIDISKIDIILEDEYFICVNKPTNMPVHPSCLHQGNTLLELVSKYMYSKGFKGKLHIINRLDRETSGVVILAKHAYIQECISRQMADNITDKRYIAVVDGIVEKDTDVIEKNIARKETSIIERCVKEDGTGEYAKTEYTVLKRNKEKNYSVLDVKIFTGRTHQIRVHMKSIGHSILGDGLYNEDKDCKKYIDRVALHARSLSIVHPVLKTRINIEAKIAEDIKRLKED